jgi:hypothetical protein
MTTEQSAALAAFARHMIEIAWDGHDADGGEIQGRAVEAGMLVPTTVDAPCGETCRCVEYGEFPATCYRLAPWMTETSEAASARRRMIRGLPAEYTQELDADSELHSDFLAAYMATLMEER